MKVKDPSSAVDSQICENGRSFWILGQSAGKAITPSMWISPCVCVGPCVCVHARACQRHIDSKQEGPTNGSWAAWRQATGSAWIAIPGSWEWEAKLGVCRVMQSRPRRFYVAAWLSGLLLRALVSRTLLQLFSQCYFSTGQTLSTAKMTWPSNNSHLWQSRWTLGLLTPHFGGFAQCLLELLIESLLYLHTMLWWSPIYFFFLSFFF